jgi:putative membrane protein
LGNFEVMVGTTPIWVAALSGWVPALVADLVLLLGTVGYGWLAWRGRRAATGPGGGVMRGPGGRAVSWLLAALAIVVAVNPPVTRFAGVLLSVHMAQHLLLIMVGPVLLVWAQPVRLLRDGGGRRLAAGVDRWLRRRWVRWASAPPTGLVVYTAVVVLTHLTGFQQLSATHGWVRGLELTAYLASGWLFFYPLLGGELTPWSLPYLVRFLMLALGMGADTLTGVVMMLTPRLIVPAYMAGHTGSLVGSLRDQQLAGAIMWFGGDLLMMLLMIVVGVRWARAGRAEQGLGNWLEGARRRSLLGLERPAAEAGETSADPGADQIDIDEDQRALDA